MSTYITHSADETVELGRQIAKHLPPKAAVLLIGNLGAGKTTLTQGIVEGLGAASRDEVASPTFTLIHEYGPRIVAECERISRLVEDLLLLAQTEAGGLPLQSEALDLREAALEVVGQVEPSALGIEPEVNILQVDGAPILVAQCRLGRRNGIE